MPVLVDLEEVFVDGQSPDAIAILTHMSIKNVEDLYISYPGLLSMMAGSETQFRNLSTAMKIGGLAMNPPITWKSVDEDAAAAHNHIGQLRRVCHRAFQACKASESYDYATALAKEEKRQPRELSLNQMKASEKEAQLAC